MVEKKRKPVVKCECGHTAQWHQTLLPDKTILVNGQKPCYGYENRGCECPRWSPDVAPEESVATG